MNTHTLRTLLVLLCLTLGLPSAKSQENKVDNQLRIENVSPNLEQMQWAMENLLKMQVFRFNLDALKNGNYEVELYLREYAKGHFVPNEDKRWVYRLGVLSEKNSAFPGITLAVRQAPDSLASLSMRIDDVMGVNPRLKLHPVEGNMYAYLARPYALGEIPAADKFEIPLLLYTSFWKDEKFGFYRCCMEREIPSSAERHEELLKVIPHFYIVGLSCSKVK